MINGYDSITYLIAFLHGNPSYCNNARKKPLNSLLIVFAKRRIRVECMRCNPELPFKSAKIRGRTAAAGDSFPRCI